MRLFFALWPPAELAERLAGIAASSAKRFGGKPTREDTIHLTLAFLGEVPEARLSLLIQIAMDIATTPFTLNINRLGYWRHNHLLWAGSTAPASTLEGLVADLHAALTGAGFSVNGEQRAFTPHLTLVRKVPDASAPAELPVIEPMAWPCSRFALVHSRSSDAGSIYQAIAQFPQFPQFPL